MNNFSETAATAMVSHQGSPTRKKKKNNYKCGVRTNIVQAQEHRLELFNRPRVYKHPHKGHGGIPSLRSSRDLRDELYHRIRIIGSSRRSETKTTPRTIRT